MFKLKVYGTICKYLAKNMAAASTAPGSALSAVSTALFTSVGRSGLYAVSPGNFVHAQLGIAGNTVAGISSYDDVTSRDLASTIDYAIDICEHKAFLTDRPTETTQNWKKFGVSLWYWNEEISTKVQ